MNTRLIAISILFLFPAIVTAGSPSTVPISARWAEDPVWDDGLAELATYEASRWIYGAARPYEAVLITVKEPFDLGRLVKADPPLDDRQIAIVLKQNAVREIETPNYPYRIMTSTFVRRADPSQLVKLTSGSHEWCGNTWQAVRARGSRASYTWQSYFDREADGRQELTVAPGDLFEDQLPLALRGLEFRDGLAFDARLLPSMANTHGGPRRWLDVRIRVVGHESLGVPSGEIQCWRVRIHGAAFDATYWFDTAGTHPLVRMETAGGDSLALKNLERRAYWVRPD